MKNFLMRVWGAVDALCSTFLVMCDNKWFAGLIALMVSFAAFCGADPVEGIPVINACCLAFLAGFLMLALLLAGSSIVLRQAYNLKTLGYSVAGAVIGTLLAYLFTLI